MATWVSGSTSAVTARTQEVRALRILVLGADGYLGWPTALHLSRQGHDVGVVDNFCRRQYDYEMGVESLVPIRTLQQRARTWSEVSGKDLDLYVGDLTDATFVDRIVKEFEPEASSTSRSRGRRPIR